MRGLEAVRACDEVWLESYTSVLGVDVAALEAFYGRPVKVATRDTVESECDQIVGACATKDVALLVVGDALCATTHTDVALRARAAGARVEVVLKVGVAVWPHARLAGWRGFGAQHGGEAGFLWCSHSS